MSGIDPATRERSRGRVNSQADLESMIPIKRRRLLCPGVRRDEEHKKIGGSIPLMNKKDGARKVPISRDYCQSPGTEGEEEKPGWLTANCREENGGQRGRREGMFDARKQWTMP